MYYPVQECHRMHLLRSTLPICLDKTFEQFSYAAFCSCFDEKVIYCQRIFDVRTYMTWRQVVRANGELFENLYTQLVDILKNFVQTEFDLLLFQSEVGNRLSLMENLIALAQRQVPNTLFRPLPPSLLPFFCHSDSYLQAMPLPSPNVCFFRDRSCPRSTPLKSLATSASI